MYQMDEDDILAEQVKSITRLLDEDHSTSPSSEHSFPTSPQLFYRFDVSSLQNDTLQLTPPTVLRKHSYPFDDFQVVQEQLIDNCLELALQQAGSRRLQTLLETGSIFQKKLIGDQLIRHLDVVIPDQFGNYVFQKLILTASPPLLAHIEKLILPNIPYFSLHPYACRVIQTLLEVGGHQVCLKISTILYPFFLQFSLDVQGNHVMQKIIEILQDQLPPDYICLLTSQFKTLAHNSFGCRVVQKAVQFNSSVRVQPLIQLIVDQALSLSKCQFGNYIVSHLFKRSDQSVRKDMLKKLKPSLIQLCCDKYSSNVIEKALESCSQDFLAQVSLSLMNTRIKGNSALITVSKNKFGNFVVKKLLTQLEEPFLGKVMNAIVQQEHWLGQHSWGSYVVKQVQRLRCR